MIISDKYYWREYSLQVIVPFSISEEVIFLLKKDETVPLWWWIINSKQFIDK